MAVIETRIDIAGAPFAQNREDMLKLIADWRAIEAKGRAEEQTKRERYHQRGQILPRERVHLLLARGSPSLGLPTLAGYKLPADKDGSLGIVRATGRERVCQYG